MKTLLILSVSIFLFSFSASNRGDDTQKTESSTVLICTGKYSKRYHNSQCRGMKACKGEQKKVSLSDAKKMGLTACGYCY